MTATFKAWMVAATPEEQVRLAHEAGTSRPYLYQIANGHRAIDSGLAGRLQHASEVVEREGGPPAVDRTDLSSACAACPYARRCREGAR